jgi:hypothetical protein
VHEATQDDRLGCVNADPHRLDKIIEGLKADNLIPLVKSVDMIGGGVFRVTVSGPVTPELRARLAGAMGGERWKIG